MLQKRPTSTVAIKRVLRQGARFICGVCRKAHGTDGEAERCLASCLHRHVNPAAAVVPEQKGRQKRYRCFFCKRVYDSEEAGRACAAECRQQTQVTIAQDKQDKASQGSPLSAASTYKEQRPATPAPKPGPAAVAKAADDDARSPKVAAKIPPPPAARVAPPPRADDNMEIDEFIPDDDVADDAEAGDGPQRKQRAPVRRDQMHKFLRDRRKLICRKCGAEHMTLDNVIACYDSHPEKVKSANDDESKFFRDGASYVCRLCQQKHFTRVDVLECFDGHDGVAPAPPDAVPASSNAAAEATPAAPEAAAAAPARNPDDDSKFVRDGARYVCRQCNERYFTRVEVVACYDKH